MTSVAVLPSVSTTNSREQDGFDSGVRGEGPHGVLGVIIRRLLTGRHIRLHRIGNDVCVHAVQQPSQGGNVRSPIRVIADTVGWTFCRRRKLLLDTAAEGLVMPRTCSRFHRSELKAGLASAASFIDDRLESWRNSPGQQPQTTYLIRSRSTRLSPGSVLHGGALRVLGAKAL